MKNVTALLVSLLVAGSIVSGMLYILLEESPEMTLDEREWSSELLQMKQEKLAEYEAHEVDVLPSRQGTVYVIDGVPSMHRPEWLTETEDVVFPETVRETPRWWFWQEQITVRQMGLVKVIVPCAVLIFSGAFGALLLFGATVEDLSVCTVTALMLSVVMGMVTSSWVVAVLVVFLTTILIISMIGVAIFLVRLFSSSRVATH